MTKRISKRDDLASDPHNANKGTERGRYMLEQSLRECGAGRSVWKEWSTWGWNRGWPRPKLELWHRPQSCISCFTYRGGPLRA
jgi:hypothetical protein